MEPNERDSFGVTRFKLTLRLFGDDLDPAHITELFACTPTKAEAKGQRITVSDRVRIARTGRWSLTVSSEDHADIEIAINQLLERLPSDPELWASLTSTYEVDLFCGIFLGATNEGFGLSPSTSRRLADRHLEIGFDLYSA